MGLNCRTARALKWGVKHLHSTKIVVTVQFNMSRMKIPGKTLILMMSLPKSSNAIIMTIFFHKIENHYSTLDIYLVQKIIYLVQKITSVGKFTNPLKGGLPPLLNRANKLMEKHGAPIIWWHNLVPPTSICLSWWLFIAFILSLGLQRRLSDLQKHLDKKKSTSAWKAQKQV